MIPQKLHWNERDLGDSLITIFDESGEEVFNVSYPDRRALETLGEIMSCYNQVPHVEVPADMLLAIEEARRII